jgi:hypothetical protein
MVGDVARGIVDPPDLDVAHSGAAGQYDASLPWFGRRFYFVPLNGLEREGIDLHVNILAENLCSHRWDLALNGVENVEAKSAC